MTTLINICLKHIAWCMRTIIFVRSRLSNLHLYLCMHTAQIPFQLTVIPTFYTLHGYVIIVHIHCNYSWMNNFFSCVCVLLSYLRYGASSATAVDNIAWLVGGVSLTQLGCCEILMLDLANKTWQGYTIPSPVSITLTCPYWSYEHLFWLIACYVSQILSSYM